MGMTGYRALITASEWDDESASIPCRDDVRFRNTEQIAARQIHVREALAYRCHDCVLFTLCTAYTEALPSEERPRGVIQAGRYYR